MGLLLNEISPSPWVRRWGAALPAGARVLDLACGRGRHLRWFAARGARVTGVDRNAEALDALRAELPQAELLAADLEGDAGWPLAERRFDAVVVTNYLWRPLLPAIVGAVAPGGLLLYETFAAGQQRFGKPSNPAFLLAPGELLQAVAGRLQVLGYEDGLDAGPPPRRVQRIAAWNAPASSDPAAARYPELPPAA